MKKKTISIIFSLLTVLIFSAGVLAAKADDLIIDQNGAVNLVITKESSVLAATTENSDKKDVKKEQPAVKSVSLVPAHTESTVKVTPPVNDEKKIQVTITSESPRQTGQANSNPSPGPKLEKSIVKTVDQVVEQGSGDRPVLSISSKKANELTISQGEVKVMTRLPLQINTLSHSLSVAPTVGQTSRVSVLPSEAFQGILATGFLDQKRLDGPIRLSQDSSGVNYTANGVRTGKLLGLIDLSTPVQVTLSAESGLVTQSSQSLLFQVFGFLIK